MKMESFEALKGHVLQLEANVSAAYARMERADF
jgi:hypothetical protein